MAKQFFLSVFMIGSWCFAGLVHPADFETVIPTVEKDAITYYVGGKIEGYGETEFMIDTGSGYTAINEQTLESLQEVGKIAFVDRVYGTLANGEEIELPVYRIASITIGEECLIRNVQAVVLPGKTRNILGLSALKLTAPFAMSVNPPQLMLSRCGIEEPLMVSKIDE